MTVGMIGMGFILSDSSRIRDRQPLLFIRWVHWDTSSVMLYTWIGDPQPLLWKKGPYSYARWNPREEGVFYVVRGIRPQTVLYEVECDWRSREILSMSPLLRGTRQGFPMDYAVNPVYPLLAVEFWIPADTNPYKYLEGISYRPDILIYDLRIRKVRWILGHVKVVEYQPAWHPQGKYLAFISSISSLKDTTQPLPQFDVFVIHLDSPESARQITFHGKAFKSLCWTPDGSAILYYSQGRKSGMGIYRVDVWTFRDTLWIPRGFAPEWSPSGRYLVYRREGDTPGLWIYDTHRNEHWRLTQYRDNYPSWARWGNP